MQRAVLFSAACARPHAPTLSAFTPRPAISAGLSVSGGPDDLLHPLARCAEAAWRWANFSPAEIACRGTGKLLVNETALDKLQALRDRFGKRLIIRSAYRGLEHNRAVGGAKASKHMEGIVFDIAMANHDPEAFEAAARVVGFQGFGFYPRSGFIHIDLGPARSWGERFPKRATAFAAETPPAREVLSESRTLKGGGAAGVATVRAAGVEVAQQVLVETQGAVLPLVPYLDTSSRRTCFASRLERASRRRSSPVKSSRSSSAAAMENLACFPR